MEAKTQAKAILRYARISPRKVNIVTDLIRNKNVATARGILMNTPKAASELLIKLLDSAVKIMNSRGANEIFLEVRSSNCKAISLYEKYGFIKTGVRKNYYENKEDAILYNFKVEK